MPELSRIADRIGIAGLYLFAFTAFISKKPAIAGLLLVALACLLDVRKLWSAGRHAPLFWLTGLVVAYISVYAVVAGYLQPEWATYHREDAAALIYLCGFILIGWCFGGSERRILIALGLALAGFLIGRIEHFDWSAASGVPWWQQRQKLGFASEIAFGQYAALAAIGVFVMAPRLWKQASSHWWRWALVFTTGILFLLSLQGVFSAASKGVWLSLFLLVPVLVILNRSVILRAGGRKIAIFSILATATLALMLVVNKDTVQTYLSAESHVYKQLARGDLDQISDEVKTRKMGSVGIRVHMWRFGLDQWRQQPVLGFGPGASRPLIAERGDDSFTRFHDLHSGYVEIPLRLGIVGVLLYAAGLVFLLVPARDAFRDRRLSRDLFVVLGSAIALHLLINTTNFRMLNSDWRFYWLLFAGALATFALHVPGRGTALEK